MGSVQSEEKCPRCGGLMATDYYYKTGEEYLMCYCCGMYDGWTIVRDSNGKAIYNKNGKVKYKHRHTKGYGAICVTNNDGWSTLYCISKPIRKKQKTEFFETINSDGIDKEKCYFGMWDEKSKTVISIYGKIPKYEE